MTEEEVHAVVAQVQDAFAELMDQPITYPHRTPLRTDLECDCQIIWLAADRAHVSIANDCPHHGRGTRYWTMIRAYYEIPQETP